MTQNGEIGIFVNGPDALIANNIVSENITTGVFFNALGSGTMTNNRSVKNFFRSTNGADENVAYSGNFIKGPGATIGASAIQTGINVCDTNTTCP